MEWSGIESKLSRVASYFVTIENSVATSSSGEKHGPSSSKTLSGGCRGLSPCIRVRRPPCENHGV